MGEEEHGDWRVLHGVSTGYIGQAKVFLGLRRRTRS